MVLSLTLNPGFFRTFCRITKLFKINQVEINQVKLFDAFVALQNHLKLIKLKLIRLNFSMLKFLTLRKKLILAGSGFDPPTSGLWAQHASTAPPC